MLKAIIIEDEVNLLQLLVHFLKNDAHYEVIANFSNAEEALQQIPSLAPDIIFLDIEMPRINGIELANRLKSDDYQFVFTTAYPQYALEAIKLEASDYLLKPITPEAIQDITPKLLKRKSMLKSLQQVAPVQKRYKIHCAGSFYALTSDNQTMKWPTRKVEELFAYLLVHSECVISKWRLAEDLWPDKSVGNIYNSVYLLNKTFKEYGFPLTVINLNEGYKLAIEDASLIHVDILAFKQIDADISSKATLELIQHFSNRGPIFNDKDYPWVTLYREQYTMKHQALLRQLIDYYADKNEVIHNNLLHEYELIYELQAD